MANISISIGMVCCLNVTRHDAPHTGWSYELEQPLDRTTVLGTKKYAFNFLAENVENKLKREGVKTKEYEHPGAACKSRVKGPFMCIICIWWFRALG